ncbi:contactin-4 isoform X2 [Ictalurus furcatus]|uniref:contactin-4 isoform X2 n=1 Tax=Ictalurus furcatus TaxID=66913 RepID=UPI0023508118|nr:contactin-4 isoform X2 [Ictalurus furcatus]XP_053491810.1 contactin-4 isoform X2 [Ictalurus furcatus]
MKMRILLSWTALTLLSLKCNLAERIIQYGPVFTQEPSDSVFPLSTEDPKIFINCKAKGNPLPHYRWKFNGKDFDTYTDLNYSLVEGNLLINNPQAMKDGGSYQCIATNAFGTILSRKAKVEFAYLQNFTSKARNAVSVREGQAVVLLCGPPLHFGEVRYSWIFNGNPSVLIQDNRRFVSQRTGNLYIAKMEPSDAGNYTCVVKNLMTNSTVYSSPTPVVLRQDDVMGEYEPKIEVQFEEMLHVVRGSSVRLECFALGNPVPSISWRRADRSPFPGKMKINQSNGVLEIPYFRPEDAGFYECVAENSRGHSIAKGQLIFDDVEHLHWVQTLHDAYMAIDANLHWECRANGKPQPVYRWLKNGQVMVSKDRIRINGGKLMLLKVNLEDSGMYQCLAENEHSVVYASAELKVVAFPPDFSKSPVKKSTLVQKGGEVIIECRPHASPKASFSWRKEGDLLKNSERRTISEDGTLRITNVSESDAGRYTCVAHNLFGVARSTGTLMVKEPTKITVPPLSMDASLGESIVLSCRVSRDSNMDLIFKWFFNGKLVDFSRHEHFEMIGGGVSGDIMVRNVQLKHSGKYVCMVHTAMDSVSAAADLIVRGPPGCPERVLVGEVTERTVQLSWRPSPDNHSPITNYVVQARSHFLIGWQAVKTVPHAVPGQMTHAIAVGLSPWVQYKFRVAAMNSVGMGEPSAPSEAVLTKAAVPEVAPTNVRGGGGSRSELVIMWEPVPEELQNGEEFGYVVAFRLLGSLVWMQTVVPSVDASRYVFKNDTFPPLSQFEVKVGEYNSIGEGPYSPISVVYSAAEEPTVAPTKVWAHSLSFSELQVFWDPILPNHSKSTILGYQVLLWEEGSLEREAMKERVIRSPAYITGLKGSTLYLISVRAHNSGGIGPTSAVINMTTKKPPPSQSPGNIEWNLTNSKIFLHWQHVKAMDNESEVTGYKVMYRQNWHRGTSIVETNQTSLELQVPSEDLLIQIKTLSDGGDGSYSSPIHIPKMSNLNSRGYFSSDANKLVHIHKVAFLMLAWLFL